MEHGLLPEPLRSRGEPEHHTTFEAAPAFGGTVEIPGCIEDQAGAVSVASLAAGIVQYGLCPCTPGRRRQFEDHTATVVVWATIQGGAIKIAFAIKDQIAKGMGAVVTRVPFALEFVQHDLIPWTTGVWRQLEDQPMSVAGATHGRCSIEVSSVIEDQAANRARPVQPE